MLTGLGALFLALTLAVQPWGNFPLNDDWIYARLVEVLFTRGQLQTSSYLSATATAQIVWGAAFALVLGFSHTTLRFATFVLGLVGVMVSYGLLRQVNAPRHLAALGAATMAVNPLYFQLANTFMTDVPFYTAALLSIWLYLRSLQDDSHWLMFWATVLAVIAVLIRQFALVVPLAYGAAYLLKNGLRFAKGWLALSPTVAVGLALVGHQWLLGLPSQQGVVNLTRLFRAPLIEQLAVPMDNSFTILIYLGLAFLPFGLALFPHLWAGWSRRGRLAAFLGGLVGLGLGVGLLLWQGRRMPLLTRPGNLLIDAGLGPATLRDVFILGLPHLTPMPRWVWWLVTAAALAGAGLLIFTIAHNLWSAFRAQPAVRATVPDYLPFRALLTPDQGTLFFLLAVSALYLLPFVLGAFFDRYLLLSVPLMMAAASVYLSRQRVAATWWAVGLSAAFLLLLGSFTVAATRDYFAWNTARWQALADLAAQGISPRQIDGGYEFNGWYNFDPARKINYADPVKSWWWVDDDEYLLAFGPVEGYAVLRRYPYPRWLPGGVGQILTLRRRGEP